MAKENGLININKLIKVVEGGIRGHAIDGAGKVNEEDAQIVIDYEEE